MTHIGDSFQRFSILKDLSFRKFWIFGSFQNWSSFNELKWTKSIDGHSRQIQVRIRNSKISTTQSKLKDFQIQKSKISHMKSFLNLLSWQKWSGLVNISPEISLILRKWHTGIKSWLVLDTIWQFFYRYWGFDGNFDFIHIKLARLFEN